MQLAHTPEEIAFRDEVRAFLADNLTEDLKRGARQTTSVFCDPAVSLPWQRILNAKGWAAPSWPVEHGGTNWTIMQKHIFASECARAGAPGLAPMGLKMVAPSIMGFGSAEQKAHYLPRILSGEDYWCQGYSEPGAGSDLASLQLRAERDGDDYVLNGSKIWTTHAHFANRIFCLVRTSREGRPQQGITFLLIDMKTPGITVSPIITLAGDHELNQVFFEDVRTPVADKLGKENEGWGVAKYLLEFERGGAMSGGLKIAVARLRAVAKEIPAIAQDDDIARQLATVEIETEALEALEMRVLSALSAGANPGPSSSLLKMHGTEVMQRIDECAITMAGIAGSVDRRRFGHNDADQGPLGTAMPRYLNNRAASIYGGSNEVQRNIIARLVLGLG